MLLASAGLTALMVSCSSDGNAPTLGGVDPNAHPPGWCSTPNDGCPCDTPGQAVDCGITHSQQGDIVTCQMGTRTCNAGSWGTCMPDGSTTQTRVPTRSRYRLLALGSTQACGSLDVCDPYCNNFTDTPTGVDAGAGLTTRDGGLELSGTLTATSSVCTGLSIAPLTPTLVVNSFTLNAAKTAITAFTSTYNGVATSPVNTLTFTPTFTIAGCAPPGTQPLWSIDRYDIATISSTGVLTLATPYAATINVTAYAGTLTATTAVTVNVDVLDTTLGPAPAGSSTKFTATTGTADPGLKLLYPYDATVFPLGLNSPLVQWDATNTAVAAADAVKVGIRFPTSAATPYFKWATVAPENYSIYLNPPTNTIPLAAGKRRDIPQAVWAAFEQSAQISSPHDGYVSVQRYRGGALYGEAKSTVTFATGQLKGKVYYQSYGTNLIQNWPNAACASPYAAGSNCTYSPQTYGANQRFGAATLLITPGSSTPSVAVGTAPAPVAGTDGCRVCHTASADGTTLVSNTHANGGSGTAPCPTIGSGISLLFFLNSDTAATYRNFSTPCTNADMAYSALYKDGTFLFSNAGPGNVYRTAAFPGGLDGSSGASTLGNRLYSLATATLGTDLTPTSFFPATVPNGDGDGVCEAGELCAAGVEKPPLRAALPAFSPDGTYLAFNHYQGDVTVGATTYTADKRSLGLMAFNAATKRFTSFSQISTEPSTGCNSATDRPGAQTYQSADAVPANITTPCTDVWPSFLPGNEGVVFEREVVNNGSIYGTTGSPDQNDFAGTRAGCDNRALACANSGSRGELWWTSLTGTRARLNKANGTDAAGATYLPTLATDPAGATAMHTSANEPVLNYSPSVNTTAIGGYYWVAFTSRRLYGNVGTMNPWWSDPRNQPLGGQYGAVTKKIWVTAVDTNPTAGADPSHPAFYLPGQELLSGNEKAIWVGSACNAAGASCDTTLDCCQTTPTTCRLDTPVASPPTKHCVANSTVACKADGATCSQDADCCNFATGSRCGAGICGPPPKVTVYTTASYTRDFQAVCPTGTFPEWGLVEWEATIPSGASVTFNASSANTSAGLASATPIVTVATATTSSTTAYAQSASTIQSLLVAAGGASQTYLRLTIQLNPPSVNALVTPSITNWRVRYDCPPAE